MRVSELVSMPVGAARGDPEVLLIRGKGDKERIVPIGRHCAAALSDWYAPEGRPVMAPSHWARRGDAEAVFLNQRGGRLTRQGMWGVIRKRGRAVGLESQMNKRANKISGGQAQRAAIARGLVNKPSIVLADEPTGNLDSVTAGVIVDLIKSMARRLDQAFIIVTHDRNQFGDVDRIITVKDGRVFEDERPPTAGVASR